MESVYLSHREARIHCLRFGEGPQLLIAVHGYADRARLFAILDDVLGKQYTVYALDLPYHGQTDWPYDAFAKSDLLAIIRQIREREQKDRLSLMGYSFGARLVLAMLPDLLPSLDKLILLAPDGIATKGMAAAVRTPMAVRRWMFHALQRPEWFLRLTRFGNRLGLVPNLIQTFLAFNLTRADRLRRAFGCWFALDSFYLRRRHIRKYLQQAQTPVDIYFGTRDEMVRFKTLKRLVDALPNARLTLLDEGHRLVGSSLKEHIR